MIVPLRRDRERGFPAVWTPQKTTGHSSTLPMDDDEKKAAAERERKKTIGFPAPDPPVIGHA